MTRELLERYLNNRCTAEEVGEVVQWIRHLPVNEDNELCKDDWNHFAGDDGIVTDSEMDAVLDRIHHRINLIEEPYAVSGRIRFLSIFSKVAAITVIPVLIFLFATIARNRALSEELSEPVADTVEVSAPLGARTVVELSDGSTVHLNNGSRIKYPYNFRGDTRSISLTGEGLFHVAHNSGKPFIVKAGHISVQALGTVFNVSAYPEDSNIATTLVEGRVSVSANDRDGNVRLLSRLEPGKQLVYNKETKSVKESAVQVDRAVAWKDGMFIFEHETLENIARKLSRSFNVEIRVDNSVAKNRCTGTFTGESLHQILELLEMITPIICSESVPVRNTDGTFSKRIIMINNKRMSN